MSANASTLVDVGCAGGIDPAWRLFGDAFRAVGFDASISECRQLTSAETHPDVKYFPGFVDIPPTHPFAVRDQGKLDYGWPLFSRSSTAWAMEFRRERLKTASAAEKRDHNAWNLTELADPSKPLFVPEILKQQGCTDVDFMKIDIDGSDFRVLNSFDGLFDGFRILALRLEVNFFGGSEDTIHTFHNTDKFMRDGGYDFFALDTGC